MDMLLEINVYLKSDNFKHELNKSHYCNIILLTSLSLAKEAGLKKYDKISRIKG